MFNPNNVSVTVVSARNLTGKGKNGKNDAFVVIKLGESKFQTSIQKKAVTPFWEEECEFFYENKYGELVLTVYHRNLLGFDEFLGQIRLPLDEVCEPPKSLNPNQRPPNRWFPLKGKSGKNDEHKYRGELEIRLLFSRKQQPVLDNQPPPRSKSPSISSFTMGREDSMEKRKQKEKTMTLPLDGPGLKKKEFMGSMPSLFGNQKLSRPPSPTGSIASFSKKKSIFSKLKSSSSFHKQPLAASERDSVGESTSARNSVSLSGGAPSPTLHSEGGIGGHRTILEPLNERQSQGFDDEEQAGAIQSVKDNQQGISPEPDDPQPVIKIQKRGGGTFTIGGGQKSRPASAFFPSERPTSILPNRFNAAAEQITGSNGAQKISASFPTQNAPVSSLPKEGTVNAATPKEDLVAVINDQRSVINRQRMRIRELEEYIDQLLVRVIATQPELLQTAPSGDNYKKRAPAAKRSSFSFSFTK